MATVREIKKRIGSVSNTKKITRTMELVSTSKSKRALNRVIASRPYADNIQLVLSGLVPLALERHNPYFRETEKPRRVRILAVTANRGLCGGYNSNIQKLAAGRVAMYQEQGAEVLLDVVGKKGLAYFRYQNIPVEETFTEWDETIQYSDLEALAEDYIKQFTEEKIDKVELVYTQFKNAAVQQAGTSQLLPLTAAEAEEGEGGAEGSNTIFEPDPVSILKTLLPMTVKTKLFQAFLEAYCAEHIYRRVAMKSATDAAGDMIKVLKRSYNRARQSKITQEIAEIVSGADAIG